MTPTRHDLRGFYSGVPHNPKYSTERGKRRHLNRDENQRKHAENVWNTNPKRTWKDD